MIDYEKGFVDIHTENIPLETVEWNKFRRFALVTIHENGTRYQLYPQNILKGMTDVDELIRYDVRCDGKEYYSSGLHSNGFTPSNLIGTCRSGNFRRLKEIVGLILSNQ